MQMRPFPFFTSKQIITYTELQGVCAEAYSAKSPRLIESIRQNLSALREAQNRRQALNILQQLDKDSLELSCFHEAWVDFSVAVFEIFVLPCKQGDAWAAEHLLANFESTYRRVINGQPAIKPRN